MIIVYLVICLLGVLLLAAGIRQRARARASERWPRVEGKVIKSESFRHKGQDFAHVEFEYSAKGRTYTSSRLGVLGSDAGGFFDPGARKILALYPPGTLVSVSYDPDDPSFGVLEPGLSRQARTTILAGGALGVLFVVVGVAGIVSSIS